MPYVENLHESRFFNLKVPGGIYRTDLHFMKFICGRFSSRLSVNIAIVGPQQIGKSSFSIWLYAQIAKCFKTPFDIRSAIFYEPLKMVESMPTEPYYVRISDEAANLLHRKEWFRQSHIALSKLITTQGFCFCAEIRTKATLIRVMASIFTTPFLSDLDKSFHKYFDMVFYVKERGRVKCWRYIARHDQPEGQETRRVFLDDFRFALKDLPPGSWEEYRPWSIEEKEKIRAHYAQKQQRQEDDFERLRAAIQGMRIGRKAGKSIIEGGQYG
jgi:hypothetical protein